MRFDIYGRFQVEVRRENGAWVAYRNELGKRVPLTDIVVPADMEEEELASYLDDLFHELAGPGQQVDIMGRAPK